jgi:hypothetical protein
VPTTPKPIRNLDSGIENLVMALGFAARAGYQHAIDGGKRSLTRKQLISKLTKPDAVGSFYASEGSLRALVHASGCGERGDHEKYKTPGKVLPS